MSIQQYTVSGTISLQNPLTDKVKQILAGLPATVNRDVSTVVYDTQGEGKIPTMSTVMSVIKDIEGFTIVFDEPTVSEMLTPDGTRIFGGPNSQLTVGELSLVLAGMPDTTVLKGKCTYSVTEPGNYFGGGSYITEHVDLDTDVSDFIETSEDLNHFIKNKDYHSASDFILERMDDWLMSIRDPEARTEIVNNLMTNVMDHLSSNK